MNLINVFSIVLISISGLSLVDTLQAEEKALSPTGLDLNESKLRCAEEYAESAQLYLSDMEWGMSQDKMRMSFDEIYKSGKRLPMHSTFQRSNNQYYLHVYRDGYFKVPITEAFIKNVVSNIELALRLEYTDFVFMADMGHTHLYFPQPYWDANYKGSKISVGGLYTQMLSDPMLRPLYHASEQLRPPEAPLSGKERLSDSSSRWSCRNMLGSNDGSGKIDLQYNKSHIRNTVSEVEGYHQYSAGFLISASYMGCFGYQDKDGVKRYFDIGLTDLQQDPLQYNPCDV